MATKKSSTSGKLTSKDARKKAEKTYSVVTNQSVKVSKTITGFDKDLAKMSNGSVIDNAYRVDVMRLRANAVRKFNSLRGKLNLLDERIAKYDENDEAVLKYRGFYWGA
jgi:hypothetical protein